MKSTTNYTEIINVLPPQIKIIVFVVVIGICFNLWHVLLWSPLQHKKKNLANSIAVLTQETSIIKQNITKLQKNLSLIAATNSETIMTKQSGQPEHEIGNKYPATSNENEFSELTTADSSRKISQVLGRLLMAKYNLALINLSASSASKVADSITKTGVWEHAITIKFHGNYFSVLNYLKNVARLNWSIYWDSLEYTVTKYPHADVTLQIRVLSN